MVSHMTSVWPIYTHYVIELIAAPRHARAEARIREDVRHRDNVLLHVRAGHARNTGLDFCCAEKNLKMSETEGKNCFPSISAMNNTI